jgi:hypothetical protein
MTSAISTTNIDEEYPVAGVDNNSQGFRDNFNNVKIALETAGSEITDLQTYTAKLGNAEATVVTNDFLGNNIVNATYNKFYGQANNIGTKNNPDTTVDIDLNSGPLQLVTLGTGTAYTLVFKHWPTTNYRYASVKIHIKGDGLSSKPVTFSTSPSGTLRYDNAFPSPFTITSSATRVHVVEAWTYLSNGSTVFLKYLGYFE